MLETYRAVEACEIELVAFVLDVCAVDRWRPSYTSRGITVSLEAHPDGSDPNIRFRCDGAADVDVFSVVASLLEIDLFSEWMPGVTRAEVVDVVSRFRRHVRITVKRPFPLGPDEIVLAAYGDVVDVATLIQDDEHERAGVAVYLKEAPTSVPRVPGRHQTELQGGWFIEQLTPTTSRITLIARLNLRLRFVPSWAVNFIIRNIAFLLIPYVSRFARHLAPGGKHHGRIASHPETYEEVRRRLAQLDADRVERHSHDEPPPSAEEPRAAKAADEGAVAAARPTFARPPRLTVPSRQAGDRPVALAAVPAAPQAAGKPCRSVENSQAGQFGLLALITLICTLFTFLPVTAQAGLAPK